MRGQVLRSQPTVWCQIFFSDRNVELLFGQLNHVRVSGTTHLLETKGLFEPLDGKCQLFSGQDSMTVLEIMESSGLSRNAVSIRLRSLKERGLIEGIAKPKSPKQRYRLVRNS